MNYNWHNLESDDVLKNVDSCINGLSDEEATVRLNKYGKNILNLRKLSEKINKDCQILIINTRFPQKKLLAMYF